jgi:predicted enzyme related to lactoylglutathione lyase
MKTNGRRIATMLAALLAGFVIGPIGAFAEFSLNANDLEAAQLTALTTFDAFTVYARSDKGVTIEAMEAARTAVDGEVFNARIKLNGGGALDYRSIRFLVKGKASLTIYLASSSKTDARILKLVDDGGTVLAELTAPPDDGAVAGIATFAIPKEGEYVVFSAGSGINIYQLVVK